ncbi:hypothetical protein B9Z55_015048 [Caenorhabditis nigoni]|uniref:SUN domain-containing protein n=1 Tax=Caenorhabditis nigoni TaxID=1611254 RepID=A0A2G5U8M5_9PELO|nr:hypothetical protein B9Z55_015048 [Caenorhabditis nigoni]
MLPTTLRTNPKDGYDAYSSSLVQWNNTFDTEEASRKPKPWYKWINNRIRQYLILEIFVVISLIMVLYRLQTISNQNDRLSEMVNSRFGIMERKIESFVSGKPNQDNYQFESTKPLEQTIADVLKDMQFSTHESTGKKEPVIIPQINRTTSESVDSIVKVPTPNELFLFNAADFLKGASVDSVHSSSSSLNPIIGFDQSSLVLLDRPHPPADKAWCTDAKNPVLTVNLAKYIKPISVSYQHSKWHEAIPNGAPKTYDVVACHDFYCEKWTPLVSNCQYSQYKSNEQMCNISSDLDVPLIGKVQFRFRENYGDTKMTCVQLVRVYGQANTPVKMEEKNLKSEEICTDLRWYYHNNHFGYAWAYKNCTVLYKNNCCSDCPECCQECLISDYNQFTFADICVKIFCACIFTFMVFFMIQTVKYEREARRVMRNQHRTRVVISASR